MNDLNASNEKRSPIFSSFPMPFRFRSVLGAIATLIMGASGELMTPLASHGAELAEILERGYLVVGVKDNVRPLGFRNNTGDLVGFEIDLARQLALDLFGTTEAVQLQPLTNQERLIRLGDDEVDVVIARVSVTTPRARLVDFSIPYYLDGTAIVTQQFGVLDISDLHGQTIAVLNGSSTIDIVRSRLPESQLVGVDSYQSALEQLETGQIAAFAADVSILSGWVQEYPNYRILPTLLSADALAVAMPRGLQYLELRQWINESLDEWTAAGWLEDRMRYWGLP